MNFRALKLGRSCCLVIVAGAIAVECKGIPQDQDQSQMGSRESAAIDGNRGMTESSESKGQPGFEAPYVASDPVTETKLGLPLLKNLARDQQAIWTSPKDLRFGDMNWLVPLGAVATASLMADAGISKALTHSPSRVRQSTRLS